VSRRTTLTLDDDVVDALSKETRRSGRSYRDVVNAAIRRGLSRAADFARFPGLRTVDPTRD